MQSKPNSNPLLREVTPRTEPDTVKSNERESGTAPEIAKLLEELTKRVEAKDKKIETYNSRVDQIPGAPPILKGPDSKRFIQKPFLLSTTRKLIPKRFRMPDIPMYNRTMDPNEHVTSYTCAIKGNDLEDDEIGWYC